MIWGRGRPRVGPGTGETPALPGLLRANELSNIDIPVLSIGAWGKSLLHLRGNFLLVVTAANLATPQLVQLAIDGGIRRNSARVILYAVVGLVVAAIVRGLATFLQGYLAERASQGVAYDLRNALFERLERLRQNSDQSRRSMRSRSMRSRSR